MSESALRRVGESDVSKMLARARERAGRDDSAKQVAPEGWLAFPQRGARYLVNNLRPDGRFVYELRPDLTFSASKYNVLRHAGSVYALAEYAQWAAQLDPSGAVAAFEAARRAADYLRRAFVSGVGPAPDALAAWDEPTLIGSSRFAPRCAKLGGAGLALTALSTMEQVEPGFSPPGYLRKLAAFIMFMQREDGGFESKLCGETIDPNFTSLYYPGEAALGLVLLFELEGEDRVLKAAVDALLYLARLREDSVTVEPDHWAMLATERLWRHRERMLGLADVPADAEPRLQKHTRQVVAALARIADTMVRRGLDAPPDRRTTPSATRLEGMIAAMAFSDAGTAETARKFSLVTARFLLSAQITGTGTTREGGLPAAVAPSDPADAGGRKDDYVRIDFVQHAICGIMRAVDARLPAELEPMAQRSS